MEFISVAGAGAVLVALTLSLQCAGRAALIHWARAYFARSMYGIGAMHAAVPMMRATSVIVVLHLLQILVCAGFYRRNSLRSWESAFYFSTANLFHGGRWRSDSPALVATLGALESITAVLMCGLSASFLFALVMRLVQREARSAAIPARSNRDPVEDNNGSGR